MHLLLSGVLAPVSPIPKSRSGSLHLIGPGHQDVFQAGGQTYKVDRGDGNPVVRGPPVVQ